MIMKHWMDCPVVVTHGRLREWQIFKRRASDQPNAETGEVCYDFNCYGRAVILPGVTTEPTVHDQELESFYIAKGEGIIQVGRNKESIRAGSSIAIPASLEHRLSNTGSEEMELIFSRRPRSSAAAEKIFTVRHWSEDRDKGSWGTSFQGHWYHIYRGPFCGDIHLGDIPPHKFSHPHSHTPILDEIWYVYSGQGWHWMGKEYHAHSAGWALWLDPTELHALMNVGEDNVEYIYCSSGALAADRARALQDQPEAKQAIEPGEMLVALEKRFGDLVAAYRKTGVGIHGVDTNIQGIQSQIAALKTALAR